MLIYVYIIATGRFLRGWFNTPPYDPATEAVQAYPPTQRPDLRVHRFDATTPEKYRAATTQELAEFDAERQAAIEQTRFDDEKMLKALAIWTAGKVGVPLNTAKQEILAVYRGLP